MEEHLSVCEGGHALIVLYVARIEWIVAIGNELNIAVIILKKISDDLRYIYDIFSSRIDRADDEDDQIELAFFFFFFGK